MKSQSSQVLELWLSPDISLSASPTLSISQGFAHLWLCLWSAHFKHYELIKSPMKSVCIMLILLPVVLARLGGSDQLYPFCSCTQESASFPGLTHVSVTLPYWKRRKAGRGLGMRLLRSQTGIKHHHCSGHGCNTLSWFQLYCPVTVPFIVITQCSINVVQYAGWEYSVWPSQCWGSHWCLSRTAVFINFYNKSPFVYHATLYKTAAASHVVSATILFSLMQVLSLFCVIVQQVLWTYDIMLKPSMCDFLFCIWSIYWV